MAVIAVTDRVECLICGKKLKLLNNTHLGKHGLTPSEYSVKFPEAATYTKTVYDNNARARKECANTREALLRSSENGKRNKGLKRTSEWCATRSEKYTGAGNPFFGKTHSENTRVRLSAYFQGVSPDEWVGFTNDEAKRAWKSKRAVRWSREILERDDFTCALCGVRGGDLEAHHIVPRRDDSKLVYDNDNGITLCTACHKTTFGKEHLFEERLGKMAKEKVPSGKSSKVLKSLF